MRRLGRDPEFALPHCLFGDPEAKGTSFGADRNSVFVFRARHTILLTRINVLLVLSLSNLGRALMRPTLTAR
jgi:hypothetical protein